MKKTSKNNQVSEKNGEKRKTKNDYHSPKLTIYGSLSELTNGGSGVGADGANTRKNSKPNQ